MPQGFKKFVQTGVVLDAEAKVGVDVSMTVGALTEQVEVQASAAQVKTDSADVGATVDSKQIQNLTLNGRNGLLGSYLPDGDPRRGWEFRAPGHGGIDWEAVIRTLNDIGYEGPLAVEWKDAGMNRDFGAEEACKFVKRLDFEAAPRSGDAAFRES